MCKICKREFKLKEIGLLNNKKVLYCPYCQSAFLESKENKRIILSDKILKIKSANKKILALYCTLILLEIICFVLFPFKKCVWLILPTIFTIKSFCEYINIDYFFWIINI